MAEFFDDQATVSSGKGKHVDYVFTMNNYNDNIINSIKEFAECECVYLVYQYERGESGTPHLQGYFRFKSRRSFKAIRDLVVAKGLRGIHLELRRGTIEQAIEYCTRESKRDTAAFAEIVEFGVRPVGAGSRTDIRSVLELVKQNKSIRQIIDEHPEAYFRYAKGIDRAKFVYQNARDFKTEIRWYYGGTGTGKSRLAFEEAGATAYWKAGGTKWWDGYEGQEFVIIDDYRCDLCPFHVLLRLFDRYPCSVEGKGCSMQFNSKVIIVTAPHKPENMWKNRSTEDINQLLRRIETIRLFGEEPIFEPRVVETFNHP